ncbi:MAG TPA: hypothetical protein PKM73_16515 [Verrucomicrobiota bacterium]|nr:hypothetical protein [Verrucomicrobiota bacterium]HNU51585.1 hypothetical protein [Verrucomicrobiota bacterium]
MDPRSESLALYHLLAYRELTPKEIVERLRLREVARSTGRPGVGFGGRRWGFSARGRRSRRREPALTGRRTGSLRTGNSARR